MNVRELLRKAFFYLQQVHRMTCSGFFRWVPYQLFSDAVYIRNFGPVTFNIEL